MTCRISRTMLAIVVASALSFGCASLPKSAKGPVFTPVAVPEGKAVVYFYRPSRMAMSANTIFMSIPDAANNCFKMDTAGYFAYVAGPGKIDVSCAKRAELGKLLHYEADLKAGDVRYVKIDYDGWGISEVFQEVPAETAKPEIAKYRMIDACK